MSLLQMTFIHLLHREIMTTPQPGTAKERNYEVYFPNTHVSYDPCGPLRFPVSFLCHATHDSEAAQIQNVGYNLFTPRPKTGKLYGGGYHSYGESYRCTVPNPNPDIFCYQPIPPTEPIFPGNYSWWGLALEEQIPRPTWIPSGELPHYLKTPPESVYGRNTFTYAFSGLLHSYAENRGCEDTDIYLLMGGTLRYKREIGYVVIICTHNDGTIWNQYPSITQSEVFEVDGLVDDNGKIDDLNGGQLHFTTRHVNTYRSYETLNFAFYFRPEEAEFRCPPQPPTLVKHDYCARFGQKCKQKWAS